MRTSFAIAIALYLAATAGCGSDVADGVGGGDCSADPFSCGANETCWPNDDVSSFVCLPGQTAAKIGDSCDFIGGQVVCPAGSICIVQDAKGVCTPYCDPDAGHGCPDLAACIKYDIEAPSRTKTYSVHACDAVTVGMPGSPSGSSSSTGGG
jgi:hypothetical protein